MAKGADLILFAVGINQKLEREGLDRETLLLPEGQRQLIDLVLQHLNVPGNLCRQLSKSHMDYSERLLERLVVIA